MEKVDLAVSLKELNFTKEEEFKVEQTNELILMIDKLRVEMIR